MILQCLIEYQTHMDIIHCEINETLCCPKEANSFAQSESASFHSFKVAGLEILLLIHIVDCFPPEHHNYQRSPGDQLTLLIYPSFFLHHLHFPIRPRFQAFDGDVGYNLEEFQIFPSDCISCSQESSHNQFKRPGDEQISDLSFDECLIVFFSNSMQFQLLKLRQQYVVWIACFSNYIK